jgi:hypothetical protein
MEYLIGSVITIIILIGMKAFLANRSSRNDRLPAIRYNQSMLFEMVKPFLNTNSFGKTLKTQATEHYDKQHVKVVVFENKAYWILDNIFYEAEEFNGQIIKESTKPVDTMALDKVQLNKMMTIVENLTEGEEYEDRNPRN